MLKVEEIEAIRQAYYREHRSVRGIARDLGHGRRVVREAIGGQTPGRRQYRLRRPKRRPVLDPVSAIIDSWLSADLTAPRKQRHTAKRVYDRLRAEHGFPGSERQVRAYVAAWGQAHRTEAEGFVPLAYPPGLEAQCDWGEARVEIAGVEQTAWLFCLRLCSSLAAFVCAFPTARQECFFAGHAAAFPFLGLVPRRVAYDNLTSAVQAVLVGRGRVQQEAFVALRGHYVFEARFCRPGLEGAHEKGLVESLVGYCRRNFLVPVPKAASWEALNALLAERCRADQARTVAGRPASIGAMLAAEVGAALPVPRVPYPCCRTVPVRPTRQGLVTFERNRYSVPPRAGGRMLLLRAFPWEIVIVDGQVELARHRRLYTRGEEHLDPHHYLALLERKPGAFSQARPILRWAEDWPPVFGTYLAALRVAEPERATRIFLRLLQLALRHGEAALAMALEAALARSCWQADGVELLLRQAQESTVPAALVDLEATPALAAVVIAPPDLRVFAALTQGGCR
jgi:transposase